MHFINMKTEIFTKALEESEKRPCLLQRNVHNKICLQILVLLRMAFCSQYSGTCLCWKLRKRLKV